MIGTSIQEYIFIRACILGLQSIAPLSLIYCLSLPFLTKRLPWQLEWWLIAETAFYFIGHIYQRKLQLPAIHPSPRSREERRLLFDRCHANINDPEQYLKGWFLGSPLEEIKRDNLKEFLLWAFFDRDGPPGDDNPQLEEFVVKIEGLLGRKLEPGRGRAMCLRLTLDKVEMQHSSLLWYWCVAFVDFLTCVKLYRHGFHLHRTALSRFFYLFPLRPFTLWANGQSPAKDLSYWVRPHTAKDKIPVVFIHGIGIGLYPYTNFLAGLNATSDTDLSHTDDQIGIIAIEIMPVSFRITSPVFEKEEMCRQIKQILDYHGFDRFVLISHSYGSIFVTHMLQSPQFANRIGPLVLIDPVTILLHHPDVAYNFTRRKPTRANEHQLYHIASMDMGVSYTLSRSFFWSQNILWKEDLVGHDATVVLAGKDLIVNTRAVRGYLTEPPEDNYPTEGQAMVESDLVGLGSQEARRYQKGRLNVLWYEYLDHAQVFDTKRTRDPVIKAVRLYCATFRAEV